MYITESPFGSSSNTFCLSSAMSTFSNSHQE